MSTASIERFPGNPLWRGAGQDEHFVQFYEDDSTLLASLQGYIEHHLNRGAAAIVIATAAHLQALEQQCLAHGLDLSGARRAGQYLPLDADDTLAKISRGGCPDARPLGALIEPLLLQAAEQYPHIVSFDEMVSLLWNQGRHTEAVRLEELWNSLAQHYAFGQYCAYPMPRHAPAAAVSEPVAPAREPGVRTASDQTARLAMAAQLQHEVRMLAAQARELPQAANATQAAATQVPHALPTVQPEITDFFEYAPLPLHSVSAEGLIEWANEAELALLGYRREEYVGHRLSEFHREAHSAAQMLSRLLTGQTLREQPVRVVCKDRVVRSFVLDCQPEWDAGRFVRSRCCLRELDSREFAEPGELADRMLEHCDQALIATSLSGHILLWNAAAERLLGYRADERRGRTSDGLFAPDSRERLQVALSMLNDAGRVAPIPLRLQSRSGRCLEAMATLSPVRDGSGQLIGVSYLLRELGCDAEREAAQLRQQLESRNRYLSVLAHELRNPLMPIANTAALLRRVHSGDPDTVASLCDLLDRQVAALRALTEEALNTSRASAPARATVVEPA